MSKYKTAASRVQPAELELAAGQNQLQLVSSCQNLSQPQDGISLKSYQGAGTRVRRRIVSAVTPIQPRELQSVVGQSQPQLVSSPQGSSQPWDGVGCNSYPAAKTRVSRNSYLAAGTRVSRRIESAATRIQPRFRN